MSTVKDTLRKLIEFSRQQQLREQRKLAAKGESTSSAKVDAYGTVIGNLSGLLKEPNKVGADDAKPPQGVGKGDA